MERGTIGLYNTGMSKPSQTSFFFLLAKDLVAQNIDVVLNRRGCMAAALRIIEENIPEVKLLFFALESRVRWVG